MMYAYIHKNIDGLCKNDIYIYINMNINVNIHIYIYIHVYILQNIRIIVYIYIYTYILKKYIYIQISCHLPGLFVVKNFKLISGLPNWFQFPPRALLSDAWRERMYMPAQLNTYQ